MDGAILMLSGLSFVFGLGLREIGGVGVRMVEAHVAGWESNGGVGMSEPILKELSGSSGGCFGAPCLGGAEVTEGDEHGGVDGAGVIQEGADDLLDTGAFVGREGFRFVGRSTNCVLTPYVTCLHLSGACLPPGGRSTDYFFDIPGHGGTGILPGRW